MTALTTLPRIPQLNGIKDLVTNFSPVARQKNSFVTNPFNNITKTGSIIGDGNIVNNGVINIGNNNKPDNSNKNFIQLLIVMLMQMLQNDDKGSYAKNGAFGLQGADLIA